MSKYPTPEKAGYFWAKLVHPSQMPLGEDWRSRDWEAVEVFVNGGAGGEWLGVFVPGVGPVQWVEDFVWGPEIAPFKSRSAA